MTGLVMWMVVFVLAGVATWIVIDVAKGERKWPEAAAAVVLVLFAIAARHVV